MLDNAYDNAQCVVVLYVLRSSSVCFLRDDGCLFLYSQVFKYL